MNPRKGPIHSLSVLPVRHSRYPSPLSVSAKLRLDIGNDCIDRSLDGERNSYAGGAYMATAVPSSLSAQGSAFTVTYRGLGTPGVAVPGTRVAGDRLIRPGLSPSS